MVDIAKALGEEPGAPMGGETSDMDDSLEAHLAAYNRAMKSNDAKGMAAAFRAAVASCQGYEDEME